MKKKNGFTLVELLAVIVILALLMIVAIPNALKMSSKVKEKSYLTKIENMENAAKVYGENHTNAINSGKFCVKFVDRELSDYKNSGGASNCEAGYDLVKGTLVTVDTLAKSNNLSYDEKNRCKLSDNNKNYQLCKKYYDNVVTNPTDDYSINNCQILVYERYNRIYAHFDRDECDKGFKNQAKLLTDSTTMAAQEYIFNDSLFK